ncbi:tRNA pseudouridine synthase A [Desulfospira joergensenii]|uniref:tRNA pseudouridine synthase A n=1 Tax=Desulfospira joergensenii TaxID=53329 RepID=UPI0003B602D3|nr:tRNA pseudouridine synthase A [Desulfospira joergensenii]
MKAYYLIHIQYLGFRFHGWQSQPGVRTVEKMLEKTLKTVLGHEDFKMLGASRTDAMVSADHSLCELFLHHPLEDWDRFLREMNANLPNDIRILKIEETTRDFNIINSPRIKEYAYYFAFGEKFHPFCASLMTCFQGRLDIDLMKQGAALFHGKHEFAQYCTRPEAKTQTVREILFTRIEENKALKASFFPERSWVWKIHSKGFLRNQIRLMMGQLICLGRGEINLKTIEDSLTDRGNKPLRQIAPPSGLILNRIRLL